MEANNFESIATKIIQIISFDFESKPYIVEE